MLNNLIRFLQRNKSMSRPASAVLPREFRFWPDDTGPVTTEEVVQMYQSGFAGAYRDPDAIAAFDAFIVGSGGSVNGQELSEQNGLTGSGEGRLILPFTFIEKHFPGCLPGAGQQVGDCVSHGAKNACLTTMACDIESGKPDEESGLVEGVPIIDPLGIAQGALSTEAIYWWRGYNGHGWSCDVAAQVCCTNSGLWLRNDYPELGIDLRKYSGSLASKYGRQAPPDAIRDYGKKHLIRTSTRLTSREQRRDFLANGYGIFHCGGEGWSSSRDENGFSRQVGRWSHAMATIAFDDRQIIKDKYGESLELIQNSWAKFNSGGRKILGTDILIPEGSFWARSSDVSRRSTFSFSGAMGWPARRLPLPLFDFGVG